MSRSGTSGRDSRFLVTNDESHVACCSVRPRPFRQPAFLYSMIGWIRLATTSSLMRHCLMSRCEGIVYMRSSISSSRMMRRPRAPDVALERLAGDRVERLVGELELDPLELEDRLVLPDQAVLGLVEDAHQRRLVELLERRDHRQAADELGDQAVLDQVLGQHVLEQAGGLLLLLALDLGAEAERLLVHAAAR